MARRRVNKRRSARQFRKGSRKTARMNVRKPGRGGFRI